MEPGLFSILAKISPLYFFVAAGFFSYRKLGARGETISGMLIYLFTPLVVLAALLRTPLTPERLVLPALFFALCCLLALCTLALARTLFPSPARNILAFASGNGNSGYYGIPVGVALLGEDAMPLIVLCSFGFILYENTLGVFIVSRAHSSVHQSLKRLVLLPSVYAFALGLVLNFQGVTLQGVAADIALSVRHTYSVLGTMIIGMAAAAMPRLQVDMRFTTFSLLTKFIGWGSATGIALLVAGDQFSPDVRTVIVFMGTLPLAANTVVWATALKAEPERAAIAVLISTFIGPLVTIIACSLWGLGSISL